MQPLSPKQAEILKLLVAICRTEGAATVAVVAERAGSPNNATRAHLVSLCAKGYATQNGGFGPFRPLRDTEGVELENILRPRLGAKKDTQ